MRLLNILTEDRNLLDSKIELTSLNFYQFKRYIQDKFQQEDTQALPPLSILSVDDLEEGVIVYGYFSKDNVIFKYFTETLTLLFDTKYISKKEALQFSTVV